MGTAACGIKVGECVSRSGFRVLGFWIQSRRRWFGVGVGFGWAGGLLSVVPMPLYLRGSMDPILQATLFVREEGLARVSKPTVSPIGVALRCWFNSSRLSPNT